MVSTVNKSHENETETNNQAKHITRQQKNDKMSHITSKIRTGTKKLKEMSPTQSRALDVFAKLIQAGLKTKRHKHPDKLRMYNEKRSHKASRRLILLIYYKQNIPTGVYQ